MAKRDIRFGNDIFEKIILEASGVIFELTYWDLWFVLLLKKLFHNEWDALIDAVSKNCSASNRNNLESIMSHIHHLREKFLHNNLDYRYINLTIDDVTLKTQFIKAKKKILDFGFQPKEKSLWMLRTPRVVFLEKALQGNSKALPESTEKYINIFRAKFKTATHYNQDQAYTLSEKLSAYIEKNESMPISKLSAFYRAFLTVIIENMGNIDDSYGQIGLLSSEIFKKYLGISWRNLNVDFRAYYDDLINLVIWEGYGTFDTFYSSLFSGLTKEETNVVALMLQSQKEILEKNNLDYQAKTALVLIKLCQDR